MKKHVLASLITSGTIALCNIAYADIYLCTDANGKKTYQNYGTSKGCKRLDIDSSTSIPAPSNVNHSGASPRPTNAPKTTPKTPSPKDFPSVSQDQQFNRDKERRRIIEDEIRNEENKLSTLKKEFNNGEPERVGGERNYARYQERVQRLKDDINKSDKNLEALRKELSTLPN
jgi:peptidoglycan hydrolase CwlO-like protein